MVLVIDTSDGTVMLLALVDRQGRLVANRRLSAQYRQSQRILPAIESLQRGVGLPLVKLDGVIVAAGPGPFTALRIGLITANTIAWTHGLPLVAVKKTVDLTFDEFVAQGMRALRTSKPTRIMEPYYGQAPNVTIKRSAQ